MRILAALILAGALGAGVSVAQKAQQKPPKKPIVLGTQQLPGDFGEFDQAYTIGKSSPINFTLKSAEYTVARFNNNDTSVVPAADEKLLVLRFTVHNPQPAEVRFNWAGLHFTAVDAKDVNYEYAQTVIREGTTEEVDFDLKPAQKVEVATVIKVPADAVIPKLMVRREEGAPVIRYNLKEKIKALDEPFGDAASKGLNALVEVPAKADVFYPGEYFDIKFEGVTYTKEALGGNELEEGKQYAVATVTLKNATRQPQGYVWSRFEGVLVDADNEKVDFQQELLKGSRNEAAEGELKPGEEYKIRFYFVLPENLKAKQIRLKEGASRIYVFNAH